MAFYKRYILLFLLFLGPFLFSEERLRSELAREVIVYEYCSPSRYYKRDRPSMKDPVEALSEGDFELLKNGLKKNEVQTLFESYAKRVLDVYAKKYNFPEDLVTFLQAEKEAREVFVMALNFRYDKIEKAAAIFNEIRKMDEALLKKYVHLATAIAVVYDDEHAMIGSRYSCVWGLKEEQFGGMPEWKDTWSYYTDKKNMRYFALPLDKLSWPVLVHLVDNDASPEDRAWVHENYKKNCKIAALYPSVEYDYSKLSSRSSGKIGSGAYNVRTLLQCGGVCGDQAHFTSRVAKTLGIPALKVAGYGRYGGMGHAWAGFLVMNRGKRQIEFTGRYLYDYYYIGDIFDPQTKTYTLDRYVAMMLDGASLSYPKYNQSMALTRMAEVLYEKHQNESLVLVQNALNLNYFNMWAWPLLMKHIKKGSVEKKKGVKWFNEMIKMLRQHPDMTFPCLQTFLQCFEKKQKQSIFEQTFKLYNSRPDLQLQLRMAQAEHLVNNGEKIIAINKLVPTIVKHAKEGTLVLPAMVQAVEIAIEYKVEKQAYKLLLKADSTFPKKRGNTLSQSYAEFKKLLNSIKK